MWYEFFLRNGIIPEVIIRPFLRFFYEIRFLKLPSNVEELQIHLNDFIDKMKKEPIAISTDIANEQHYELPTRFFKYILGDNMKYSCGHWEGCPTKKELIEKLNLSEEKMLELTCKRAGIKNGDKILDLGCGWGSLSLFIKENYQNTKITAISNSSTQKVYIESKKEENDYKDLKVITANIVDLKVEENFDVIVSIEMFEHMRNYEKLLEKLYGFLKPEGTLFVHIFTDKNYPYFFELDNPRNFMAKYFFRGGIMPSTDLLFYLTSHFSVEKAWKANGTHYRNTL